MSYLYTKKEFIDILKRCLDSNNIYVSGGFGVNLSIPSQLERYTTNNEYNRTHADQIKACAKKGQAWGWDCICLIKSIFWGFDFDTSAKFGGANYKSNNVMDYGTGKFFKEYCYDQQWITKEPVPECALVWTEGHIATSLGDGLALESTRYGDAVVRIVGIRGIYKGNEYPKRHFDKWGYCQFIDYSDFIPGDVNGDGVLDARDYMLVKRIVMGTYDPTDEELKRADVNGDGTVDARDYMLLKRRVLGI